MLALYPDAATVASLAVPGGLAPDALHVTVAYVGDAADTDPAALRAAAQTLAARAPIGARVAGGARFTGGDKDVLVALVDSPAIEDLRRDAMDQCAALGIDVPREHGYTAHLTRMYVERDAITPQRLEPAPVTFSAISAVHGGTRTDFPFAAPAPEIESVADLARRAYATGWARTGGPLTDRVKAGCVAAMDMAREHADDPGILEATLKLGSLEGTWALVYQRREDLIDAQAAKVAKAWRRTLTREQVAWAVADYRRRAGLAEADQDQKDRDARTLADATAAAAAMLQLLPGRPGWQDLRTSIRDALAAGQAEGIVGAVAIAADRIEKVGLDWNLAFEHALNSLENLQTIWADVDGWLAKMLDRATGDLGRALADATREGASYEQMLADAMDMLGSDDIDAVTFTLDWAMTTALAQGALSLYASEGVSAVDWITAGDDRVCPNCGANEDAGPYDPSSFPAQPDHPGCRCTSASSMDLAAYASLFTTA
jgi:2'-5' RNA ligase